MPRQTYDDISGLKMDEREIIRHLLINGFSVEIEDLSICCINRFYGGRHFTTLHYQVDSENTSSPYSKLFTNLDNALNEFLRIKSQLYRAKNSKSVGNKYFDLLKKYVELMESGVVDKNVVREYERYSSEK